MSHERTRRRSDVRTPALLLDLNTLEANVAAMADRARLLGVVLRPHAKSHKCIEIARRLCAAGALGASCATPDEAEAMAAGGIRGLLITSPQSTVEALTRIRRLLLRAADLMLVADHPEQVEQYAAIAIHTGRTLPVLVDFDVGQGRTGCLEVRDAMAVAQLIAKCTSLRFGGVQAYWGQLQHVVSLEERKRLVEPQAKRLASLISALTENGLKPDIVTGGGTGTHWIDGQTKLFTELQPGSFLFLDSKYTTTELSPEPNPFRSSLFVAAAVVSANSSDRVIVNAGFKAFATDSGHPVPLRGAPERATYRFMGDEHGAIEFGTRPKPSLGSLIELLPSRSDTTVNLYGRYHVVCGESIIDEWTIAARGYSS